MQNNFAKKIAKGGLICSFAHLYTIKSADSVSYIAKKLLPLLKIECKTKKYDIFTMKKRIIWISVTAVVVVVALAAGGAYAWIEYDKKNKVEEPEKITTGVDVVEEADFAYVDVEEVIKLSNIDKTEGATLRTRIENAQTRLAKREQKLQNEMQDLATKYQRGLITTRDAQQKEQELQNKAMKFQQSAQAEISELNEEYDVYQNRVADLIKRAVKEINSKKQYKVIAYKAFLLDADESYDLSNKVLEKANALYAAEKAEAQKK